MVLAACEKKHLFSRLADRLADIALGSISASLYCAQNVQVTAILGDMVDFFTYRDFTLI